MSDFIVIIPARLESSRLPQKLLQTVDNKPLIYHTYKTALASNAKEVIIATDSKAIIKKMEPYGANCILTDENHISGTSRIAEAITQLNLADDQIIINLQGDEPLMPSCNINQLAENLKQNDALVATLREKFKSKEEYLQNNNVKVVFDNNNFALYFSRSPIPFFRDSSIDLNLCFKHIGIYGYKAEFFKKNIKNHKYEDAEKLEQLSILANGYKIHIDQARKPSGIGIDTMEDLINLNKYFDDN